MVDYLVYTQAVIFITYITFLQIKFGTLPSISQSFYALKKKGYLFTFFCFGLSIPMILIAGYSPHTHSWLFFMSGVGLGFVGVASSFKQRITDIVHYTGAAIGIIFTLVGIWVVYGLWLPFFMALAFSTAIVKLRMNNAIYWIEVVCVVAIVVGILAR